MQPQFLQYHTFSKFQLFQFCFLHSIYNFALIFSLFLLPFSPLSILIPIQSLDTSASGSTTAFLHSCHQQLICFFIFKLSNIHQTPFLLYCILLKLPGTVYPAASEHVMNWCRRVFFLVHCLWGHSQHLPLVLQYFQLLVPGEIDVRATAFGAALGQQNLYECYICIPLHRHIDVNDIWNLVLSCSLKEKPQVIATFSAACFSAESSEKKIELGLMRVVSIMLCWCDTVLVTSRHGCGSPAGSAGSKSSLLRTVHHLHVTLLVTPLIVPHSCFD